MRVKIRYLKNFGSWDASKQGRYSYIMLSVFDLHIFIPSESNLQESWTSYQWLIGCVQTAMHANVSVLC